MTTFLEVILLREGPLHRKQRRPLRSQAIPVIQTEGWKLICLDAQAGSRGTWWRINIVLRWLRAFVGDLLVAGVNGILGSPRSANDSRALH